MAIGPGAKVNFGNKMVQFITNIIQNSDAADDLVDIYFDRGYNDVGADPILDADVASCGLNAELVAAGVTLFQNLYKFKHNDTPTQADYDATFNKIRNDK